MRYTCLAFALVLASLATHAATPLFVDATAADNFKVYWLIKADTAPAIDGKLDDAVWQKAQPLEDWGTTNYGRTRGGMGKDFIPGEIDLRAAWDDTYLYLAARCYHRLHPHDMVEFKRQVADVSKAIYARECLEIHIDGNLDHATRFQSIVNPLGERMMIWHYDFGWGLLHNVDYGLDADWDVASRMLDDGWSVEVRYALRDIQVRPRVGAMFGINPCWFDWADSRAGKGEKYWWQYVTWSTHGDSHHDPRLYGRFVLVENQPKTLADGLRLAFPDLDRRTIMVQGADGLVVFRNGRVSTASYDAQIRREAGAARRRWQKLQALLDSGRPRNADRWRRNVLPQTDAVLADVEKGLAADSPLSRGAVGALRARLAAARRQLDDAYWAVKQDALLSTLAAGTVDGQP